MQTKEKKLLKGDKGDQTAVSAQENLTLIIYATETGNGEEDLSAYVMHVQLPVFGNRKFSYNPCSCQEQSYVVDIIILCLVRESTNRTHLRVGPNNPLQRFVIVMMPMIPSQSNIQPTLFVILILGYIRMHNVSRLALHWSSIHVRPPGRALIRDNNYILLQLMKIRKNGHIEREIQEIKDPMETDDVVH